MILHKKSEGASRGLTEGVDDMTRKNGLHKSGRSYFYFTKVSFAGLLRRAPQLTAQSAVHF